MQQLLNSLSKFERIDLSQMDEVKLMDRVDTKYVLSLGQLPLLLKHLETSYSILYIKENAIPAYKTIYFDTPDFELYLKHHNGNLNRYKIRYRKYEDSGLGFLEVKFKNNKGRTIKQRIKQMELPLEWNEDSARFITENSPYKAEQLFPTLAVNYNRLTFVSKTFNERITMDVNLKFTTNGSAKKMDNLVIVEIKCGRRTENPGMAAVKSMRIKHESLSKYCMGINLLYPHLKKNNFKQQLTTLNKIANDKHTYITAGF